MGTLVTLGALPPPRAEVLADTEAAMRELSMRVECVDGEFRASCEVASATDANVRHRFHDEAPGLRSAVLGCAEQVANYRKWAAQR